MLLKYSKFFMWWVSLLMILTGTFWSYYFGVINMIWESDTTYITSIIAFMFVTANIFLGWLSYKFAFNPLQYKKHLETVWFTSEQLMALGMLGTVIGLIHMLAANFIGAADGSMQSLLSDMWKAMGLALYTNAVGLIASIILKFQVYAIGHGLDEA